MADFFTDDMFDPMDQTSRAFDGLMKARRGEQLKTLKTYETQVKESIKTFKDKEGELSKATQTYFSKMQGLVNETVRSSDKEMAALNEKRLQQILDLAKKQLKGNQTNFIEEQYRVAKDIIEKQGGRTSTYLGGMIKNIGQDVANNAKEELNSIKRALKPTNLMKSASGYNPVVSSTIDWISDYNRSRKLGKASLKQALAQDKAGITRTLEGAMEKMFLDSGDDLDFGAEFLGGGGEPMFGSVGPEPKKGKKPKRPKKVKRRAPKTVAPQGAMGGVDTAWDDLPGFEGGLDEAALTLTMT